MIRTIHKLSTAAAAAAALAALAAAPAAQADWHWQPATTVIPGTYGHPAVAISETKAITVAAPELDGGGVLVSTRAPSGSWSAPVKLGGGGTTRASAVHVATNAQGDVVVGWADGTQHVAVRPNGQAFLPTVDLPGSGTLDGENFTPLVGIDDQQEVVTAWAGAADHGTELHYTAGTLGAPVQAIHSSRDAPGSENSIAQFSLRTIPQGQTALAWIGYDGSLSTVHVAVRGPGADFGTPQQLTTANELPSAPQVTVNELGQAAVAYTTYDGTNRRVELSRAQAGRPFEPGVVVSPAGSNTQEPDLGWVIGSDIHLAWTTYGGLDFQAVSALAPQSGPLGVLDTHSYDATDGSPVRVLVSHAQRTMTAYARPDGGMRSIGWLMHDIEARRVWSVIDGPTTAWGSPALAGDEAADAVAAWGDGPDATEVGIWDATAPAVTVTAPESATAGQPFRLTVGADDALSGIANRTVTFNGTGGVAVAGPRVGADGSATATLARPGTYTILARATDTGDNASTAMGMITVLAAPRPPVVAKPTCKVPSLRNHSVAYARRVLTVWRCRLGRVTTPKRYKHVKGLVIRTQSRPAGQKPTVGAHVNVTLGVKPRPRKHRKHKH